MLRSGGKFCSQMRILFYLDGPDGFQRYWHDEAIPPEIFSTRHSGRAPIVVRGAFLYRVAMKLQVVQGSQNATVYIGMLEQSLLFTEGARLCGEDWIFQQVNAANHTTHR